MSGKWFFTPDDDSYRIGLIARHYETEAQEPGYLTEDDARHRPEMTNSFNATDKGTRRMNQVSLHFDTDLTDTLAWSAKTYINTLDDRRWTQYWRTSSQQERDTYETQYGALTSLTCARKSAGYTISPLRAVRTYSNSKTRVSVIAPETVHAWRPLATSSLTSTPTALMSRPKSNRSSH